MLALGIASLLVSIPFGIAFIVLEGMIVGLYYLLRWVFSEMADANTLVTKRTEGECKAVLKGESCVSWIIDVDNHLIDPYDFYIFKGSLDDVQAYADRLLEVHRDKQKKTLIKEGVEAANPNYNAAFVEKKLKTDTKGNPVVRQKKIKNKDGSVKETFDHAELDPKFLKALRKINEPSWFERLFGVVWVGFPPYKVLGYRFRWLKHGQENAKDGKPSGTVGMWPKDEEVDSLYWRYTQYGIVINDAWTGGTVESEKKTPPPNSGRSGSDNAQDTLPQKTPERILLLLWFVMETVTRNPQKTLFRTAGLSSAGDWLNAMSRDVRNEIRSWLGEEKTYDYLIQKKGKVERELAEIVSKINGVEKIDNVERRMLTQVFTEKSSEGGAEIDNREWHPVNVSAVLDYGQEIISLRLVKVDFADDELKKSVVAISTSEQLRRKAEKDLQVAVLQAQATQAKEAAPGLALAQALKAQVEALGKDGVVKIRQAEAVGNIKGTYAPGKGSGLLLNIDEPSDKSSE